MTPQSWSQRIVSEQCGLPNLIPRFIVLEVVAESLVWVIARKTKLW